MQWATYSQLCKCELHLLIARTLPARDHLRPAMTRAVNARLATEGSGTNEMVPLLSMGDRTGYCVGGNSVKDKSAR